MRQVGITLALVVLGALVSSLALAQQSARVHRIGLLLLGSPNFEFVAFNVRAGGFADGLRELGYIDGRNVVVEERTGRGQVAALQGEASRLVAANVDVIVAAGNGATLAAMRATSRVPIVFISATDPVETGLVASFARPGGNVTGMATGIARGKRFQLVREAFPAIRKVGILRSLQNLPDAGSAVAERSAAAAAGVEPIYLDWNGTDDIDPKLLELAGAGIKAVVIDLGDSLSEHRSQILEATLRHGLGTVCDSLAWAAIGCLLTYAEVRYDSDRRAAAIVDRILKGAKPADIPVEQPVKFRFVVNAGVAKGMGLTLPPSLLQLADEVLD